MAGSSDGRAGDRAEVLVVCPQQRDRAGACGTLAAHFRSLRGARPRRDSSARPEALATSLLLCRPTASSARRTAPRCSPPSSPSAARPARPDPAAVVRCQHKPTSRQIQQQVAPEATPRFAPLDGSPPFPAPWFVQAGGRAALPGHAARRDEPGAGRARARDGLRRRLDALASLSGAPPAADGFLVEELVDGRRGDARGLRPRRPRDRHRRHRLDVLPRHGRASSASSTRRRCRRRGSMSWRARGRCCPRTASTTASSTSSSSCPTTARRR